MVEVILVLIAIIFIILIFQRWFWVLGFGLGTIASFFALIASIIHFQILGAIGFLILTFILYAFTVIVSAKYND
ncbi:MAG: hypothetical protein KAR62_01005 [Sphingomonadales bacterium]|nr:hypothetical protein [Sphingomonadales bacterium]